MGTLSAPSVSDTTGATSTIPPHLRKPAPSVTSSTDASDPKWAKIKATKPARQVYSAAAQQVIARDRAEENDVTVADSDDSDE